MQIVTKKQRAKLILFYNYNVEDFFNPIIMDGITYYLLEK